MKDHDERPGASALLQKLSAIPPFKNAADFVRQYADKNTEISKFLKELSNSQVETFYMDYNWDLNQAQIPD